MKRRKIHDQEYGELVKMKKLISIIPENMRLPLLLAIICNTAAYYGTRFVTRGWYHFNLSNGLDDRIPFVPWTVAIYLGCYLFWVVNYILGCRQDERTVFRFISADFVAKLVCLVIFLVFPTTNIRPAVEGTSFWDMVMVWLYAADAADNLFPSIHCLTSWFCLIAVRDNPKIPGWYKAASLLFAIAVCVSTLTTKQHVIIDVAGGIVLAEGSYLLVVKSGFSRRYAHCLKRLNRKLIGGGRKFE